MSESKVYQDIQEVACCVEDAARVMQEQGVRAWSTTMVCPPSHYDGNVKGMVGFLQTLVRDAGVRTCASVQGDFISVSLSRVDDGMGLG
ncbi:MAG: hypothetical protein WAZ18_06865 [Alphaproteobacteria bacterium]